MSARSCLLCGRSLSRWSASDDDFCCREHRNQYRLRRSMDRLQEANKVASVMRRRESPRPLKASRLINGGPREPRAFADSKLAPPQSASIPQLAPACPPRMAPVGDLVTIPLAVPGASDRSLCPAPLPVRGSAPVVMPLRVAAAAPAPRTAPPIRGIEKNSAAAQMRRRLMVSAWRSSTRPVLGEILPRAEAPRVYPMAENARPGAFGTAAAAAKGRALRVSLAAGFRIPEWKLRPLLFRGPSAAGMVWPGLRLLDADPFGPEASATPAGMAPADILGVPQMRIPAAPCPIFLTTFRWPGAMEVSLASANPAVLHRDAFVPFTTSEEYSAKERPYEYRN